MILVTGATGNVGAAAIAELVAKKQRARAFVRDERKASSRLGQGVELAVGDFGDRASIARALDGVEALLLSSADAPDKVRWETSVIDEARNAGVRKIVKVSTMGADPASPMPPLAWHGQIEEHLRASGAPSIILHSCFYMTNLLASAEPIRQMGKLFAAAGGAKIAMIDPRDTGAVAAVAVTTDDYVGQTLDLTGPEAVTYESVADALSRATGRTIEFVDIPDEAAKGALTEAGLPEWLVTHLSLLFPMLRRGTFDQTTDTVRALTGRNPRSLDDFAGDFASAFGA
jgi:uncharacterized protein YbjT (DUF2867 family)